MKAFHNKDSLKRNLMARLTGLRHDNAAAQRLDERRAAGGHLIGHIIEDTEMGSWEARLGIARPIALLAERLYHKLPGDRARIFPEQLLDAITPGTRLELADWLFLQQLLQGAHTRGTVAALDKTLDTPPIPAIAAMAGEMASGKTPDTTETQALLKQAGPLRITGHATEDWADRAAAATARYLHDTATGTTTENEECAALCAEYIGGCSGDAAIREQLYRDIADILILALKSTRPTDEETDTPRICGLYGAASGEEQLNYSVGQGIAHKLNGNLIVTAIKPCPDPADHYHVYARRRNESGPEFILSRINGRHLEEVQYFRPNRDE